MSTAHKNTSKKTKFCGVSKMSTLFAASSLVQKKKLARDISLRRGASDLAHTGLLLMCCVSKLVSSLSRTSIA
jgi:hypothetical protein